MSLKENDIWNEHQKEMQAESIVGKQARFEEGKGIVLEEWKDEPEVAPAFEDSKFVQGVGVIKTSIQ